MNLEGMRLRGWIYVWFLPLYWCFFSLASFRFPGDEYGLWIIGSFPGVVIALQALGNAGDIHNFLFPVMLCGGLLMAVIGFGMDRLRVPHLLSLILLAAGVSLAYAVLSTLDWPPIRTSRDKFLTHGLVAGNLGLYFAIVLSVAVTLIAKLHDRRGTKRRAAPAPAER